jgi:dTDP-4-dehydrorhamnose 3,5-epimerase
MRVIPCSIPDLLVIEPDLFGDERGFFMETWHAKKYRAQGMALPFVQDNHSRSSRGVLRGLHYQLRQPQGKLVRVTSGAVYDVAVDIRLGSPHFGQWAGVELSGENHRQFYIPPGFAHGFCVTSESADFLYKCTDFYLPEDECGINWNDSDIGIEWPGMEFAVSEKDGRNKSLKELMDLGLLPKY